jgi:hypothetical protein
MCTFWGYSMKSQTRLLLVAGPALALACWVCAQLTAAPPDGPQAEVRKIADDLAKSDTGKARDAAKSVADKNELADVMHMFSPRTAKGEGVGPKPGAIKPDGIEAKLYSMTKRVAPAELKNDGEALERMAYITAAIAEIAGHKAPKEKKGEMDPAKWKQWSEEMHKSALDLAKEIKAGDPMKVKAAATKLDNTCKNCHGVFRDA